MGEGTTVSIEDVRRVAELANLELTLDEEQRMRQDLNSILGHIAALERLDTTGVPPMAQVGEILVDAAAPDLAGAALRADLIRSSTDRATVMAAAPETDGRFFKVPKVIER